MRRPLEYEIPVAQKSDLDQSYSITTLQTNAGNLTCDQGEVAYGYVRAALSVPIEVATSYFSNWTTSDVVPASLTNASGTDVGATRSYDYLNGTFDQQLNVLNTTEQGINLQWNLTEPTLVSLGSGLPNSPELNVTIYKNVEDLTFYSNDTTGTNYLQYWSVGCFSNQTLGYSYSIRGTSAYLSIFTQGLSQLLG